MKTFAQRFLLAYLTIISPAALMFQPAIGQWAVIGVGVLVLFNVTYRWGRDDALTARRKERWPLRDTGGFISISVESRDDSLIRAWEYRLRRDGVIE